jgi:hypothetical protein
MDGTPLDKLLYQGLISPEEYSVIDDFLADVYRAGMVTLKARPYWKVMGSTGSSSDQSEDQAHLAALVRKLSGLIGRIAGASALDAVLNLSHLTLTHPEKIRSAAAALSSSSAMALRHAHRRS